MGYIPTNNQPHVLFVWLAFSGALQGPVVDILGKPTKPVRENLYRSLSTVKVSRQKYAQSCQAN